METYAGIDLHSRVKDKGGISSLLTDLGIM